MKKIKIYLIPHCHWDREWFHPEPTFQVLLQQQMRDLAKWDGPYYNFDGHTWALDDYLKTNTLDPQMAAKMKKGIINFGPLYVQSDFYNSTFATLQTNLNIGKELTNKYSKLTDLMYIADSFGFNEQLPQVFVKNGFKKFIAWRGIKKEDVAKSNLLTWAGIDGSQLRATYMADSYTTVVGATGFGLGFESYPYHVLDFNKNPEIIQNFKTKVIDPAVKARKSRSKQDVYWMPYGHDWSAVPQNSKQFVAALNKLDDEHEFIIGSYEDYFKAVAHLDAPKLEYNNLFYSGTSKIHRSIASNRYDIKKAFRDSEYQLFYQMEQLEIMFAKLGGERYSKAFKEEYIYKPLLAASAHDSLGGCNDDLTNHLALSRLIKLKKTIESYCDFMIRQIRMNQKMKAHDYIIFNPAPFEQDVLYFDKLSSSHENGLHYQDENTIITTLKTDDDSHPGQAVKCFNHYAAVSAQKMKPLSFRIVSLKDKSLTKTDLEMETPNSPLPFTLVIDENYGDEFDFSTDESAQSQTYQDFKITSNYQIGTLKVLTGYYEDKFINTPFRLNFTLLDDGHKKYWQAQTNNGLKNARLLLEFNDDKVWLSRNLAFVKQEKDNIPNWKELGYRDKPINHFTNDGLVHLSSGLNILTKGTNEVELQDQKMRIVLARFSSHIGKPNLAYRPGGASGPPKQLKTPDAQLTKSLTFDFGFSNEQPVVALNEWIFQGFGSQEGQKDYLNQKVDYFHLNTPIFTAQKIDTPIIDHKQYLIGLYQLKNDKVKYIIANPKAEANKLKPYEINYDNY